MAVMYNNAAVSVGVQGLALVPAFSSSGYPVFPEMEVLGLEFC
jgi:hypothetical protein